MAVYHAEAVRKRRDCLDGEPLRGKRRDDMLYESRSDAGGDIAALPRRNDAVFGGLEVRSCVADVLSQGHKVGVRKGDSDIVHAICLLGVVSF
jgi:hypothetical protein